jgi:hypothetical protein
MTKRDAKKPEQTIVQYVRGGEEAGADGDAYPSGSTRKQNTSQELFTCKD